VGAKHPIEQELKPSRKGGFVLKAGRVCHGAEVKDSDDTGGNKLSFSY
jgi:hypothetical protein